MTEDLAKLGIEAQEFKEKLWLFLEEHRIEPIKEREVKLLMNSLMDKIDFLED